MALILTEKKDSTGIITLKHAEKRNALSEALIMEITAALDGFRALDIRAVVLRAEPRIKVWSAGHDVSELPDSGRDPLGWNDPLRVLIRAIQEFPAPVIGLIEGSVWGGARDAWWRIVSARKDVLEFLLAYGPARLRHAHASSVVRLARQDQGRSAIAQHGGDVLVGQKG